MTWSEVSFVSRSSSEVGTPNSKPIAKVALVKGSSRSQNIQAALSLIREDIKASLVGKRRVLIKPNLTSLDNIYANTSIETVEAVADFLNGLEKKEIVVGESSGSAYYAGKSTWDVFRYFGYDKLVEKYPNLKLVNFDEAREHLKVKVETLHGGDEVKIVKHPYDFVVSLAIPKTHDYAIATLSLKNMMGLVAREDRLKIHGLLRTGEIAGLNTRLGPIKYQYLFYRFLPKSILGMVKSKETYKQNVRLIHKNLLAVIRQTRPDLAVIDGYYGMHGNGPTGGEGIKHGIAIASLDPVRADSLAAACMGFQPEEIGYLHYCAQEGIGSISLDNILGTTPQKVRIKYKPHRDYKYQKDWR